MNTFRVNVLIHVGPKWWVVFPEGLIRLFFFENYLTQWWKGRFLFDLNFYWGGVIRFRIKNLRSLIVSLCDNLAPGQWVLFITVPQGIAKSTESQDSWTSEKIYQNLYRRVWSWLRVNAGGVVKTCKSNEKRTFGFVDSGERVRNTWATCPWVGDNLPKGGLIPQMPFTAWWNG